MTQKFSSIAVCGGGAWGTALAILAANNDVDTRLWARNSNVVDDINNNHKNSQYLPDIPIPASIHATTQLESVTEADAILFMIPAQQARCVLEYLSKHANHGMPVALGCKGIERGTHLLMPEVLSQSWPEAGVSMLSGPSFAHDVARGKPTAVTLAAANAQEGLQWQETIGARHFRPYLSDDLTGTALGGAVKNVLAIAAGIVEGLQLGESAHAALIARGFAEFQRLGLAMGASTSTMVGLSGLGDLILTAGSPRSRNMSLGQKLGQGMHLEDILASRNSVSEGVASAAAVMELAATHNVEMPVCGAVADIVEGRASLEATITNLMSRPFRKEG